MKNKGSLIIISGPSGVGKGTVRAKLMEDSSLNLFYSVSMTTRDKRPGEVDGKDYFFVTKEEFEKNIQRGNFIEFAQYVGNYYGTPKDKVEKMLDDGKNVILEIEVKGAKDVIEKIPQVLSIFIVPPSVEELEKRLVGRGTESPEVIADRIARAKKELEYKKYYKYVVVNDKLDDTVNELRKIILGVR